MFLKLPFFGVFSQPIININAGWVGQQAGAPGELKAERSRARKSRQG